MIRVVWVEILNKMDHGTTIIMIIRCTILNLILVTMDMEDT
jgi:hypothetical protein